MIRSIYQRSRFWGFFTILFLGMGIGLNQIDAPTASQTELFEKVNKKCTPKEQDYPIGECAKAYVQIEEFDSESEML